MSKILLLIVVMACVNIVACSVTVNNMFPSTIERSVNSTSYCCLPDVFTMNVFTVTKDEDNNEITQAQFKWSANYKEGKMKQDIIGMNGQKTINWFLNLNSSSVVVMYTMQQDNNCQCFNIRQPNPIFNPKCVSAENSIISKETIGMYYGNRIVSKDLKNQVWIFRDNQLVSNEKCWILNSFEIREKQVTDVSFSNMVERFDEKIMNLPPQCPPITQCLQ